jgi:hypothetical protein
MLDEVDADSAVAAEGASLKDIADAVRKELAESLSQDPDEG